MKRPVGVTLTAIVEILGSLLVLLFSIMTLLTPALMRNSRATAPPPAIPQGMVYGITAFYGLFAVLGFLTGVGLFRMRNWARYSTLVFSGFLLSMGLVMTLVFVAMPIPVPPPDAAKISPNTIAAIKIVTTGFSLGFAVLGSVWLYYFNRASTKAAFRLEGPDSVVNAKGVEIRGRRVPVSIVVIAGLELLGGVFMLSMTAWTPAAMFFGVVITGWAAKLFTLGIAFLAICLGIALCRLSNIGRLVAIATHCVWIVNSLITALLPQRVLQYMSYIEETMGQPAGTAAQFSEAAVRFFSVLGAGVMIIAIYFLVTRGDAFRQGEPDEVAVA